MNSTELIDALVKRYKQQYKKYPECYALGALEAKFSSCLDYVSDLIDAIDSNKPEKVEFRAAVVRNFINRLEEEAKA